MRKQFYIGIILGCVLAKIFTHQTIATAITLMIILKIGEQTFKPKVEKWKLK